MLTDGDFPVEFGRYTLLGVLGEGAMARVYRAELRGPGGFTKPTALKIVRGSVAGRGAELRDALLNEARLGGLLDHPNLVQTLDYGVVDGLPFIAMGHVRGVGLDLLLASDLDIPPEVALDIAIQLASGLDHAHNLEGTELPTALVHRDLKPSNIILDRHGNARILDFGIAKAAAFSVDTTAVGATKGTPAYMSPEQANGEELDPRSDIFSLGVLIYELVLRERLFASTSPLATLQAVLRVEDVLSDPSFEGRLEAIVPGLGMVVSRCLREAPRLRWSTAAEVHRSLRSVAAGFTPAPMLREWVRETQDALGLGHHDPAGLSLDTPILGAVSFDPHGRPRALAAKDADDVETDASVRSIDDADVAQRAATRAVPETRNMPAAGAEPGPKKLSRVGLILVALGGALLTTIAWAMLREAPSDTPTIIAVGASEPGTDADAPDLSEPLSEAEEQEETPELTVPAPRQPRRPATRAKPAETKTAETAETASPGLSPDPPKLNVSLQQAEREGGLARVMVTARLEAPADAKLAVHAKKPMGPWQSYPLKSMGPGGWFVLLEVNIPAGAPLRWYVTAEFEFKGRRARIRQGTKVSPQKFTLPRP